MLSNKMAEALNVQVNKEMYSGYLYMAMSASCTSMGLAGFANWFMVQYHEEMAHAMKLYDYIHRQGNKVTLMTIDQPQTEFDSTLAMCEKTLDHEKFVTGLIDNLVELAKSEDDANTESFLQWFVKEQVEEEESAENLLKKVEAAGTNGDALKALNKELAAREFHPPK